jgi:hypothetical protein
MKCVSDGADVTGVSIEVLASRGMLPTWELIVIWREAGFAYQNRGSGRKRPSASEPAIRVH